MLERSFGSLGPQEVKDLNATLLLPSEVKRRGATFCRGGLVLTAVRFANKWSTARNAKSLLS